MEISGPVAAGNPPIDRHQRTQIAFLQRTHRHLVARQRSEIRGRLTTVIDLGGFPHVLREDNSGASSYDRHSLSCRYSSSIDFASGVRTERSSIKRGASPKPEASKNRSKAWLVQSAWDCSD